MIESPPKLQAFARMMICGRNQKPWKILILGQRGVGKSAFVVRFLTRRFIWDYSSSAEAFYTANVKLNFESVTLQLCDLSYPSENTDDINVNNVENHCRSADACVVLYAINDPCSLEEAERLKFLVDHARRRRRFSVNNKFSNSGNDKNSEIPVALIGCKADLVRERLVTAETGRKRALAMNCTMFREVSVKDSAEEVHSVVEELHRIWRKTGRNSLNADYIVSPLSGGSWSYGSPPNSDTFRCRSSTEGSATLSRIRAWPFTRLTSSRSAVISDVTERTLQCRNRRMSFSTKGSP